MAGDVSRFAFLNAKLRTRIGVMLPDNLFLSIRRSGSLAAGLSLLAGTPYSRLTGDLETVEGELLAEEIRDLSGIIKGLTGPVEQYASSLMERYIIELLKRALRAVFSRQVLHVDPPVIPIEPAADLFPRLPLRKIAEAGNLDEAEELLAGRIYGGVVKEEKDTVLNTGSLFPLENSLDILFYRLVLKALELLSDRDREIAGRMTGLEIDIHNLSRIYRFTESLSLPTEKALTFLIPGGYKVQTAGLKKTLSSGRPRDRLTEYAASLFPGFDTLLSGKTSETFGRLALFDSILETLLDREIRKVLLGNPFTVGILPAYTILKRREIRNLVSALNSAAYGSSHDEKAASL
ncbi:MAG: V-type ATPase subunit [Spirochaetales bacterium]|nr:V-type ATPase subunit [Spirochaetales bacterium]